MNEYEARLDSSLFRMVTLLQRMEREGSRTPVAKWGRKSAPTLTTMPKPEPAAEVQA